MAHEAVDDFRASRAWSSNDTVDLIMRFAKDKGAIALCEGDPAGRELMATFDRRFEGTLESLDQTKGELSQVEGNKLLTKVESERINKFNELTTQKDRLHDEEIEQVCRWAEEFARKKGTGWSGSGGNENGDGDVS